MQNIKQKRPSLNSHHSLIILKLKTSEADCQRWLVIASTFEITSFLSGHLLFSTSKLYYSSINCQRLLNYTISRHSWNANHKHLFGTHFAEIQRQINLQHKNEKNNNNIYMILIVQNELTNFILFKIGEKKLKVEYIDKKRIKVEGPKRQKQLVYSHTYPRFVGIDLVGFRRGQTLRTFHQRFGELGFCSNY